MTKDEILKIIEYAKENKISEKQSAYELGFGLMHGLTRLKQKYNIPYKKQRVITKNDVENILLYSKENKIPEKESMKIFGFNVSLSKYKKKFGIKPNKVGFGKFVYRKKRKYIINDDFFEKPNMINSYYAGFIAADGCISKNEKELSITLSKKDESWIKQFIKDLDSNYPIHNSTCRKKYKVSSLRITSKKICDDLKKNFNIIPKKTLTLMPPNLNNIDLIYSFICGYIDGDGCISLYKRNKNLKILEIYVLGTKNMCLWIKEMLNKFLTSNGSFNESYNGEKISRFKFSGISARNVYEYFYNLDIPKLHRKWRHEIYEYCVNFNKIHKQKNRKEIIVFDENKNFIRKCSSLTEASKFSGVSLSRISALIKNNSNKAYKSYIFKSIIEENETS